MCRPHYLNFEVEQTNVMAGSQIYYVILKTKFLGLKSNAEKKIIEIKRSGCRKYKR